MKYRNTYKILILIILCVMFIKIIDVNAEEEEEEMQICEPQTRTYLFSEASSNPSGKPSFGGKSDTTTFYDDLPEKSRILSVTVVDKRPMSKDEFIKFMEINSGSGECTNNGYGYKDVCRSDGYYTNSGNEGATDGYHASGVSDYGEYYDNHVVQATDIQVSFTAGENHILHSSVNRTWNAPTKSTITQSLNSDPDYMYLVPLSVTIKIEYESTDCEGNPDDSEDPDDDSCPPDSADVGTNNSLNCSNGTFEENDREDITTSRTIYEGTDEYDFYKGNDIDHGTTCSTELTETIKANVNVSQKGYANFTLNPTSQFSGGGFDFMANYVSSAEYKFCEREYTVSQIQVRYYCPTISDTIAPNSTTRSHNGYSYRVKTTSTVDAPPSPVNKKCNYTKTVVTTLELSSAAYNDDPDYYDNQCSTGVSCTSSTCTCNISSVSSPYQTTDASEDCSNKHVETYKCGSSGSAPYQGCDNYQTEEVKAIGQVMSSYLQTPDLLSTKPMSYDSNIEGSTTLVDMGGTWSYNQVDTSVWYPETKRNFSAYYQLGTACINIYDANVRYETSGTCTDEEINGGNLYYIPLKTIDGFNFKVKLDVSEISIVNLMNWGFTYDCDVNCRQELFDLEKGGYLYFFRPIALDDPFPNNRTPGVNWQDWIFFHVNQERLIDTYSTTNNIEYIVYLENNDVNAIKQYNSGTTYIDYEQTLEKNGDSKFITGQFGYLFDLKNVKHSALGVYDPEDDTP